MTFHGSAFAERWQAGLLLLASACATAPRERVLPPIPAPSATVRCDGFATLEPGRPVVSSTREGLDTLHGRCVPESQAACVFQLEVPVRSALRVRLEASDFDAALSLFEGPRESPSELACIDDTPVGDLLHARIDSVVEPGSYLIVVDSAAGETGSFELFPELDPLPEKGLACSEPLVLSEGMYARGSTRGGTSSFSATCAGGAAGPDHVYAIDVPEASRVRVRMSGEFDAALSLRRSCSSLDSELACNDESGRPREAALVAALGAGRYYVVADSFSPLQSGDYTLLYERVTEPAATTLEAVCEGLEGTRLSPGYHELDTLSAPSLMEGTCGGAKAPERALSFRVDTESVLHATLAASEMDAILYVLRDCLDEASEVACFVPPADDADPELPRALVKKLEPGSYTLVVDGATPSEMGAVGLYVSLERD